jgi:hypothetical protein
VTPEEDYRTALLDDQAKPAQFTQPVADIARCRRPADAMDRAAGRRDGVDRSCGAERISRTPSRGLVEEPLELGRRSASWITPGYGSRSMREITRAA